MTNPDIKNNKAQSDKKTAYNLERYVLDTITEYSMISDGDHVLVGLSGGADSVCLLMILHSLRKDLSFSLGACHLNHMIRGDEAERDMLFSKELCKVLGVDFYSESIDIPAICKKKKGSVEEIARNERYAFFERISACYGFTKIATAHTLSDNAETVIMNLTRSVTPEGLCGIPPIRGRFIRPLIRMTRSSVEKYLEIKNQPFVTDSTNLGCDYTRNFVRAQIIPLIKSLNPSFEENAFLIARSCDEDMRFIEEYTEALDIGTDISAICAHPISVIKRHLKSMAKKAYGEDYHLPAERATVMTNALFDVARDGKKRKISLPGKKHAYFSTSGIIFRDNDIDKTDENCFDIPLFPGQNIINEEFAIFMSESEDIPDVIKNQDIVYKMYKKTECASDIINGSLSARNRLPSDALRLGGITRNLKKAFIDKKIPSEKRKLFPVVYDEDGILAVPIFDRMRDGKSEYTSGQKLYIVFYRA